MFDYLANPSRFTRLSDRLFMPISIITVICLGAGLYLDVCIASRLSARRHCALFIFMYLPHGWLCLVMSGLGYAVVLSCMAPSSGRYCRTRHSPGRGSLCAFDIDHRGVVGQADVGHGGSGMRALHPCLFCSFLSRGHCTGEWVDRPERGSHQPPCLPWSGLSMCPS